MLTNILLAGLVIFLTNTAEAITGFGCTVMALPFITAIFGIEIGVKVLTIISFTLASYTIISKWKYINFKVFFTIFPIMLLGLPIGMQLFRNIDPFYLKKALAIFITCVAISQLYLFFKKAENKVEKPTSILKTIILLFSGGIVQGAFSSGGPLVVLYAKSKLKHKTEFRATLSLLWVTLNTVILTRFFIEGTLTSEICFTYLKMVPFLIMGIILGEYLHHRISQRIFSLVVYIGLLITGIFMLIF